MQGLWWRAGLAGLMVAGMSGDARAQEAISCDFIMTANGLISGAELVRAIESGQRPLANNLQGCLEDRGAPAELINAVRRRMGRPEMAGAGSVIPVDTANAQWPQEIGKRLADLTRFLAPGNRPSAILYKKDWDAQPAWWYAEFQDKVADALLTRLPSGSAAADHPDVLDVDAVDLLDPQARVAAEQLLGKMGFRRTLVIEETAGSSEGIVNVKMWVRDLDAEGYGDDRGEGTIQLVRAENAEDDVDVNAVTEIVSDRPADKIKQVRPEEAVKLTVSLKDPTNGEPVDGRRLDAVAAGKTIGEFERIEPGVFEIVVPIPPHEEIPATDPEDLDNDDAQGEWVVSWTYNRADGGLAIHELRIPIQLTQDIIIENQRTEMGDGKVHLTMDFGAGVFAGTGGASGARLRGDLGDLNYTYLLSDRPNWGAASGLRVPVGVQVVWKFLKAGADIGFRVPLGGGRHTWRPFLPDPGLAGETIELELLPLYGLDIGGRVMGGSWIDLGADQKDRLAIYGGLWVGYGIQNLRGSVQDGSAKGNFGMSGGGMILGPTVSIDAQLVDRVGVSLDVISHVWSATRGPIAPFTTGQFRLWLRLL